MDGLTGAALNDAIRALRRAAWSEGADGKISVDGTDDQGFLVVRVQTPEATFQLRVPDVQTLSALVGPPLRTERPLDGLALPFQPQTAPVVQVLSREVGPGVSFVRAGDTAQQVEGIDLITLSRLRGAAFTSRGPTLEAQGVEYKPFNEDAVVLRARPASVHGQMMAVGVFDQAGGEGSVEDQHGAASAAAARCFDEAIARIEEGAPPEEALREAVQRASEAVRSLEVGAVSTFAAALVIVPADPARPPRAYVANVGDSRVICVGADGTVRNKTRLHNMGAAVAAGEMPEIPPPFALQFASGLSRGLGTEDVEPDLHEWTLQPGDRIIAETDGVGDARELEEMPLGVWHADRSADDQARVLQHVPSAGEAVKMLVGYALDQVAAHYGKPDNIAVGVIEVLPATG